MKLNDIYIDLFYSSCALNYLSNPYKVLSIVANKKVPLVCLTRNNFSKIPNAFVQISDLSDNGFGHHFNKYGNPLIWYPSQTLCENTIKEIFLSSNYELIFDETIVESGIIKNKDNYFGAIYGVSILTHLSLEDQRRWIEELIRIARPGGIIILSYHGLNSLIRFNLTEESFAELNETRYLNIGKSDSLGKDSELGSKYYDSVQLASSFDKIIPKYRTEVLFHESVFGNHQDVVVIKKNS